MVGTIISTGSTQQPSRLKSNEVFLHMFVGSPAVVCRRSWKEKWRCLKTKKMGEKKSHPRQLSRRSSCRAAHRYQPTKLWFFLPHL